MRFDAKKLKTTAWMTLAIGGLMLTNSRTGTAQVTLQTTPDQNKSEAASDSEIESPQQLQARKQILSLCEKLAEQADTSLLRPLYTEDAFKTQCGEWILTAVDLSGIDDDELEDSPALGNLKKFVQANKLDELDLDAIFADDESMFGSKVVAEAYEKLPAENRLEIALKCGTLVHAMMEQFRMMDQTAEGNQAKQPASNDEGGENPTGDEASLLEFFLGGKVQEIIWAGDRATLRAGTQPSDISDEELEEMGLKRDELTESPYPEKFFNFVQLDGKWLFDGVDTAKSYASFEEKMEKFPSLSMELMMPLIENIQLQGAAVSGKQIVLSDYKGKVVLIDCWGTWCGPCVASLPKLKELYKEFHEQGLEIIGVAADDKEDLEKFLNKRPLPWDHIVDSEGALAEKLGVEAYPTVLLVDREGKNVKNFVGDSTELKQAIGLLLEGKSLESLLDPADSETSASNSDK